MILDFAQTQRLQGAVLCDSIVHPSCQRESLLWLLREHISSNLVKIGKDFCLQKLGIPQGSTLSTLLCCFYLGRMEQELGIYAAPQTESTPPINSDGSSTTAQDILMRYTDDFLFISTDKERAQRFFNVMQQGSTKYNCFIAPDKTIANFALHNDQRDCASIGTSNHAVGTVNEGREFGWCSYLIDTRMLTVRYDLSRYIGACLGDSLTIPSQHAHAILLSRVLSATVQRRNLPVFLDVRLNGVETVAINIHQSFALAAMKLLAAVRALQERASPLPCRSGRGARKRHLDALMSRSILPIVDHSYAHASSKMARSTATTQVAHRKEGDQGIQTAEETLAPVWPIGRQTYKWIALHAIISVLDLRPSTRKTSLHALLSEHFDASSANLARMQRSAARRDAGTSSGMSRGHRPHLTGTDLPLHRLQHAARRAWSEARSVFRTISLR